MEKSPSEDRVTSKDQSGGLSSASPENHSHEVFMRRALELAALGLGNTAPNPVVGCVIVHEGKIIGEGWHQRYGGPHAEVNAVAAVADPVLLSQSTVYVTLEPCAHFGKTPPCADLLVRHGVKKVVVANIDPFHLVAGEGIKKLRAAGIAVVTGILDKPARLLNRRFFTQVEQQRPHIILKWAETADGFVARENHDSKWISDAYSRQLVHKWRTEESAVLVGARTAQHDDPQLNVRDWTGRDPVRVVIDRFLKLNRKLKLFDGAQRTLRYNVLTHEEHNNLTLIRLGEEHFLQELVHDLHRQKIQSLIVEGGTFTLQAFIDAGLWDEARIFVSPKIFGKGIAAPVLKGYKFHETQLERDVLRTCFRAET